MFVFSSVSYAEPGPSYGSIWTASRISNSATFGGNVALDIRPGVVPSFLCPDINGYKILRFYFDGRKVVAAGTGSRGYSGDTGPASKAELYFPTSVAVTRDGGFLIVESDGDVSVIRKVSPSGGVLSLRRTITTVSGMGRRGLSGDGGPATKARLYCPSGVTETTDGAFLIADSGNCLVRKVSPNGIVTTVAGTSCQNGLDAYLARLSADEAEIPAQPEFSGDGGQATDAKLSSLGGVAAASDGGFFVIDWEHLVIRKVSNAGIITTVAGTHNQLGLTGDNGPAISATLHTPNGIAETADGGFLISDRNGVIRKVSPGKTPAERIITTVAGKRHNMFENSGDGGSATDATLKFPSGVTPTPDGGFFTVAGNYVRFVAPNDTLDHELTELVRVGKAARKSHETDRYEQIVARLKQLATPPGSPQQVDWTKVLEKPTLLERLSQELFSELDQYTKHERETLLSWMYSFRARMALETLNAQN